MTYQQNSFRAFYLILVDIVLSFHTFVLAANSPSAVPTFECIGLSPTLTNKET
jgi:hypothetical protein